MPAGECLEQNAEARANTRRLEQQRRGRQGAEESEAVGVACGEQHDIAECGRNVALPLEIVSPGCDGGVGFQRQTVSTARGNGHDIRQSIRRLSPPTGA